MKPSPDKEPTRALLLTSAETLFATQGFLQTKISDISDQAGISANTVYEHFKSKDELLIAIPEQKVIENIKRNEDHLRGLEGAGVKLRKLVWNYLEFASNNKDYFKLFLFEIRSNRDFYNSPTHDVIKQYTDVYRQIIVEGQQTGEFQRDLSPSLILHLIFGAVDSILITWIIENRPSNPLDLFEDFFDVLINAVAVKQPTAGDKDKRLKILNAAISIFSQIGYKKARIQDIAKTAGVGEGTIYKYFSSKEDILFSIALDRSKELIEEQKEHLSGIQSLDLRLEILIRDYLHYINKNTEYNAIFNFDCRYNIAFYQTEAYGLIKQFTRIFHDTLMEGVQTNAFRPNINPYMVTKMIFGVIDHTSISSIMFGRPRRFSNVSEAIIELLMNALKR